MYREQNGNCSYNIRSVAESSCSYTGLPVKRSYSKCLQRLQKTYEKHKANPLPPVFKERLDGPSAVWKVFRRLQMATEYADSYTKGCMVFSYEEQVENTGQRMFLVASPKHMWLNHKYRPLEKRCTYEVIRENYPCKLYFDLEYYTLFNKGKDGNLMTKIFIKCVIAAMFEQHDLAIKESDFLWLDASTEQKFSCHLILQTNGVAFQNNIDAGIFVSSLMTALRKRIEDNASSEDLWPSADEIKILLVETKNSNNVFFCDEGVYSKNRNFRMYLSTKFGKNTPLVLSPNNQYVPSTDKMCADKEEAVFYDSLVTYFRNQDVSRLLSYESKKAVLPHISFPTKRQSKTFGVSGYSSSPYPDVDHFVLNITKDDFAVGFIRKWTYLSDEQTIFYDIGNYRYCHNIARHHKSNNIRIVVDMKFRCYYQTCLDPECRQQGFKSEVTAIPEDILFVNVPDDFFDANCFSQLPCEDKDDSDCSIQNHTKEPLNSESSNSSFVNEIYAKNMAFYPQDAFPLRKTENEISYSRTDNQSQDQFSWDSFFFEDFSCKLNDTKKQELNNDDDFSSPFSEDCCNTGFTTDDSTKILLGNVSHEEELLMAEAVEVTEASINNNIFFEETMF